MICSLAIIFDHLNVKEAFGRSCQISLITSDRKRYALCFLPSPPFSLQHFSHSRDGHIAALQTEGEEGGLGREDGGEVCYAPCINKSRRQGITPSRPELYTAHTGCKINKMNIKSVLNQFQSRYFLQKILALR